MNHSHQPRLGAGKILLLLVLLLAVNSAYLAAFGNPTLFYVANALLHPLLGLAATLLLLWRLKTYGYGLLTSVSGIYLMIVGMTRPHSLALYIHVGLAILVLLLFLGQVRSFADEGRTAVSERYREGARTYRRVFAVSSVVMVGSLASYGAVAVYHRLRPDPRDLIENPATAPMSMEREGGGSDSLVFPSSAVTANGKTIPAEFFMNSESCKKCHPDIYNQWFSSMHHFASFNNQWYRKSIEYMQDTIGIKPSLWCGGCHDHALVFTNQMQKIPIRQIEHTPEGSERRYAFARRTAKAGKPSTPARAIAPKAS